MYSAFNVENENLRWEWEKKSPKRQERINIAEGGQEIDLDQDAGWDGWWPHEDWVYKTSNNKKEKRRRPGPHTARSSIQHVHI